MGSTARPLKRAPPRRGSRSIRRPLLYPTERENIVQHIKLIGVFIPDPPVGETTTSGVLWVIYPEEIARVGHRY